MERSKTHSELRASRVLGRVRMALGVVSAMVIVLACQEERNARAGDSLREERPEENTNYSLGTASWVQGKKLNASDATAGNWFGVCASVSGAVAVVGAMYDAAPGERSGSAYVFRCDGNSWVEEQKLTASDAAAGDEFGHSVSVSANVVVVGASGDNNAGAGSGSAYVFRYDGANWVQEQKLTASDAAAYDWFGHSVSVSDDVAVVGAHSDPTAAITAPLRIADLQGRRGGGGLAYVYRCDGTAWMEEQKLTASDAATKDFFGGSVSVSGTVAVAGATGDDAAGESSGSAYVFSTRDLALDTNPGR